MTLVQASVANNGKSIIMIADRLLTMEIAEELSEYEFESVRPKIMLNKNIGIGFAGSALMADLADEVISKSKGVREIVAVISEYIKNEHNGMIEHIVKRYSGLTPEEFFKNTDYDIPEEVRNLIYGQTGSLELPIDCLVAGYSGDNPIIVDIGHTGEPLELTSLDSFAIGSGAWFSRIFFDMNEYDSSKCNEIEGLYFAFKAKKWSEAPTGVGRKSDIIILRANKEASLILDDSLIMEGLEHTLEREKYFKKKRIEKDLTKLVNDYEGVLYED